MDKIINEKLAERIKALRGELGLSQEELAKCLNVSRSKISQMENNDVRITAEELVALANIFNVSVESLIDFNKAPKVILEKGKEEKQEEGIRINVPQKNVKKFKEVLLYILNKVGAKPNVGETVLYKLLYFIDFDFYEKYEEQLIGATYIKNHHGPTPVEFKEIVGEMIKNKEIMIVNKEFFKYPQRKYYPLRKPDLSVLGAHEQEIIDKVLHNLSDMNAKEISDYSHNDVPWLTTEDGHPIEYESVFYRTRPYSVREYEGEDI
jgi:transcriptional regulator with XRE-family HTH domain